MDPHVFYVVEVFEVPQFEAGGGHHLAHVFCFLAEEGVGHAAHPEVAALLAPVDGGVPPLEGFLAGGVAEAPLAVRSVG